MCAAAAACSGVSLLASVSRLQSRQATNHLSVAPAGRHSRMGSRAAGTSEGERGVVLGDVSATRTDRVDRQADSQFRDG